MHREDAFKALAVPHMFRVAGLSFLIPGVVSASLPSEFSVPAAYGDLGAVLLAFMAVAALSVRRLLAMPVLWLLTLWGSIDLLNAIYRGQVARIGPGTFGAAYFIPALIVPGLLIAHAMMLWLLLRPKRLAPAPSMVPRSRSCATGACRKCRKQRFDSIASNRPKVLQRQNSSCSKRCSRTSFAPNY
jgi:hypothetical protein